MFERHKKYDITYTSKADGKVTERTIVPTFVPDGNIKAIDVTDLIERDQQRVAELTKEYAAYYEQASKTIFTFADWISHTQNDEKLLENLKWRTFALKNIKV